METLTELIQTLSLPISDQSHVADARRQAAGLTAYVTNSEEERGRVALVVTELATNILKHAESGEILVQPAQTCSEFSTGVKLNQIHGRVGIDIIALDKGGGIANINESMRDGQSTAGSAGTGLGAIQRQSDLFEVYSLPGKGTVIHSRIMFGEEPLKKFEPTQKRIQIGGVNVALSTEEVSGDAWSCRQVGETIAVLAVDGIGHGDDAHKASRRAIEHFVSAKIQSADSLLRDMHALLKSSRGAAASVMLWDVDRDHLRFAGVGNVIATIVSDNGLKKLANYNGTLGHSLLSLQEFNYPRPQEAVLILHSDGIQSQWNLDAYPGILSRSALMIASVLYRDHKRGRDDVSVVVIKST